MWNKPWAKPAAAAVAAGLLFAAVSVLLTRESTGRGALKGSPVDRLTAFSKDVGLAPADALCSRESKESSYEARATLYRGAPKPFQLDKFAPFSPAGDLGQAPAAILPEAALTAGWPAESKCAWPKGIDRAIMRRKDLLLRRGAGPTPNG